MMTGWWLSSAKMTVYVATDQNKVITVAAPVVAKFTGQPIGNLSRWMQKQGGFKWKKLENDRDE